MCKQTNNQASKQANARACVVCVNCGRFFRAVKRRPVPPPHLFHVVSVVAAVVVLTLCHGHNSLVRGHKTGSCKSGEEDNIERSGMKIEISYHQNYYQNERGKGTQKLRFSARAVASPRCLVEILRTDPSMCSTPYEIVAP